MRHYPTDLLLAVEEAAAPLTALLRREKLDGLVPLLDGAPLAEALDELLGGLSQYPWQPLADTNDVYELRPAGAVALDDHRPGNTLRGLLYAWATGNTVVIRSSRPALWQEVLETLRGTGLPLPEGRVTGPDAPADALPVTVPDLVPVPGGRPLPAWWDEQLYAPSRTPGEPAIGIAVPASGDGLPAPVSALDARDDWTRGLLRRVYLPGTTLAAVRNADPERTGRLDAKLRYLLGTARRAPYYRDLPRVRGTAELDRLPMLTKDLLEAHSLPRSADLSSGARPSGEVLRSGATSGEPRYVVFSRTDWENMVREALPVLRELGVRNGDRVVNTLIGGSMYGGLLTSASELTRLPVEAYSTGQQITVDLLLKLVDHFDANVLLGQPALILPLLRDAKKQHPGLRIETVIYGGTAMTESDKKWLRTELGTRKITSILAANDGAQLGYQCGELGGTLHHLNDDYNLIEVVDDEGRPLPDGESGELLVTSLQKFEGPLIRYRIGDVGRIVERDCACGVSGRTLEYLGRSDGLLRFKSCTVHHHEVLAALETFRVSQLQLELDTREHRETLILRTESPEPLDAARVRAHLTSTLPALSDEQLYDDSLSAFELVVECLAEGELPRNPVSAKIRPVIDRRVAQPSPSPSPSRRRTPQG